MRSRHAPLRTIKLQGAMTRPVGMVVSHDGKRLYTVTGRGKRLLSIDIATGKVLGSVEVGAAALGRGAQSRWQPGCSLPMAAPTMSRWWMPRP